VDDVTAVDVDLGRSVRWACGGCALRCMRGGGEPISLIVNKDGAYYLKFTMLHLWHFALAILLFLGVNWIGEHSSAFGYLRLSLHVGEVPAPAFNFVLKALAPTVYIIIVSTVCYVLKRENLVQGIWLVAAYYFVFRLLFNIAFGRAALLDWFSLLTQAIVARK
jgi:hypothetical protein